MNPPSLSVTDTIERPEDVVSLLNEHGKSISKSAAKQILTFLKQIRTVIEGYEKQDTAPAVPSSIPQ